VCGDSTERETYKQLLGDEIPDLLLTDPPYGVAYQDRRGARVAGDLTQAAFPIALACSAEVIGPDARLYVFCASDQLMMTDRVFNHLLGMRPRLLVWVKEGFVLRRAGYHGQYELVAFGWKGRGGGEAFWFGDRKQSDVLQISRDRDRFHPTQKPVALCEVLLRNSTPQGGAVLEPFAGSGSTLIAAERAGRRCFAIELDAALCDRIVQRWEALTGREATCDPRP
jgi:DNA modification methylase